VAVPNRSVVRRSCLLYVPESLGFVYIQSENRCEAIMSLRREVMLAVICACIIAAIWLMAVPRVSAAASLDSQPPGSDLGAILLDSGDVPPGFELDPARSGYREESLPGPSWSSPIMRRAARYREYRRLWIHREMRRAITALVDEAYSRVTPEVEHDNG
jgi:hypothetical protein